jgi:hypothetical protein
VTGKLISSLNSSKRTWISPKKVDTNLRQMEVKHALLQHKVAGWCIWPTLRFEVGCMLENMPLAKRDSMSPIKLLLLAIYGIKGFASLRSARIVTKTYTSGLVEREGVLYKDIWFDDLLKEVDSYLKIETINSPNFTTRRKAALIKSDLTTTFIDIFAALLARIGGPSYISEIARSLSACLKNELNLDVLSSQQIKRRLRNFYWHKKIYAYLLRRVRPKYLLTADPCEHALVAAAKEQGIKVIEFQHGLINRYHYAYSWTTNAVKHRSSMPVPDVLFLHGEYSREELDANGFWGDALCVVGSLRMDQYRNRQRIKHREEVFTLVLTTQGIDVNKIIDLMVDFLEAAKKQLDIQLYIKLHPVYETNKTLYEGAFKDDPRVQVLLGIEDPSTFDLLTLADFHLSISSTCHYDALGLGVPTIILPFATHENVLSLYEAGHAFLANTSTELVDILLRWKDWDVPNEVGEFYFKTGALQNMKRELMHFLSKSK